MKLMTPEKDGQLVLDFDDVVQRSMTVVRDGELDLAAAARAGVRCPRSPGCRGSGRRVRPSTPMSAARRFGIVG